MKITSIETIIFKNEWAILQINFYHKKQLFVTAGWVECDEFQEYAGRREVFEIAEDE